MREPERSFESCVCRLLDQSVNALARGRKSAIVEIEEIERGDERIDPDARGLHFGMTEVAENPRPTRPTINPMMDSTTSNSTTVKPAAPAPGHCPRSLPLLRVYHDS